MRTLLRIFAIAICAAATVAARAEDPAPRTAKVTYVSGSSIYLDAGSEEGLAVGDRVELVRDGTVAATLTVSYVTAHKATCSTEGAAVEIRIGDALQFAPHAAPAVSAASAPASNGEPQRTERPRSRESAFRRAGLRGRIGVRYLWAEDRSGLGESFSQPSLDLFLAGAQMGGQPLDLNVDLRARRTYRTPEGGPSSNDGLDHVYQANLAWRPGPVRLALGRQVSPTLAVANLFDGLVAEYRGGGFTAGVLAGTQPDPATYAFASDVRQYGAYGGFASDAAKATRWRFSLGAISSTENGEVNRDFVYVEAQLTHRIVGLYVQQQVDVNRGWRKDAEGSGTTPSASFVMLHLRPGDSWTIDSGYDSRRNVLLYRDFVTPVTTFDDATRQGYWLGGSWRPQGRWLVGIDGRRSTGGAAGTTTSYSARLGAMNMSPAQIDVQLRGTRYTGPSLDGYLAAVSASIDLGSRVRLDLHGGARRDSGMLAIVDSETIDWLGTMLDVTLGRSIYLNLTYDRTTGGEEDNDQLYAAFSWRF